MIAYNGGASHGVAEENGREDEVHIHDDAVDRYTVRTHQAHELPVIEHGDDGHGDVRHKLRSAVGAGLYQRTQVELGAAQVELTFIGKGEIQQGDHAADPLTDSGGQRGADDAPLENGDEQCVQYHVGNTGGHGDVKPQIGPLRRDKKALERALQHKGNHRGENNAPIADTDGEHGLIRAQKAGHGR